MSIERGGPSPEEIGVIPQEIESPAATESGAESSDIARVKSGDIISLGNKKVKVVGFTAPEGDPGRALFTKEPTTQELEKYEMRQAFLNKRTSSFIESAPTATPKEVDSVRQEWGKIYDRGLGADMQINKLYELRFRENAQYWRDKILTLENSMNRAQDEAEKQAIQAQIIEARESAEHFSQEAEHRKRYIQESIDRE